VRGACGRAPQNRKVDELRFISQYPNYTPQVRPMRQRALGDGGVEVTQEPLYVPFTPPSQGAFIFENEVALALKQFNFHGNTQEVGEAAPTDPLARLSVLDTDEFAERKDLTQEDKLLIERHLAWLARESPNELLLVTSKPVEAPFPRYDSFDGDPEQLVAKLAEDGYDLNQILYYETSFGPKRPEVVKALQELIEVEAEQTVSA
jgi:hypothetical protein